MLDPLASAIASCTTYQAVAGHVIFSGGAGPVLDSYSLAARLFSRGGSSDDGIPAAVDWLLRMLATRKTTGLFKVALCGLSLDQRLH